ncbi:thiamine pyrophosphate-binding protein [Orrella sp. JC864]|uniref:thiamine pyrophosphate-binding protein n=1 Tax=Orrella sp. JC864 TaxID=3120298 RepID=UPI003009BEB0
MAKLDKVVPGQAPTKMEWGSDVAAEMLRRIGIKYVALNPGASYRGFHDSLVNYLGNEDPGMLLCLHEDHVVSIAHGYAKVTDSPMGAVLHSNVGLLHGSMGIFNAYCDRMPMVVVGATGPVDGHKRRPWIDWIHTAKDQGALVRDFIKWDDEPRSAQATVEAFWRGAQLTRAEPRAPVYICLDAGLQETRLDTGIALGQAQRYQPSEPPRASQQAIEHLADTLLAARRPLLLFGRGSRDMQAWDLRIELAELLGASVMTSIRDRAVFPTEHPLMAVPPVYWLNPEAKAAVEQADVILSLDWVDLNGLLKQVWEDTGAMTATLAHASLDSQLHRGWSMDYFGLPPTDIPLQASPDAVVEQLVQVLRVRLGGQPRWQGERSSQPALPEYSAGSADEIAPRDIEVALQRLRGDLPISLAHATYGWAGDAFHCRGPLDFLGSDGGAGLAAGPGLTVGIALALKGSGRLVVSVMGDGDFLQGATALWTAARYELPALIIVSNNRSNFNDEMHQEAVARIRGRPVENRWIGQRIDDPAPDLAALARAQGVDGEGPVRNVPDLERAILRGLEAVKRGKPYFIDAHVATGYAIAPLSRGK